MLLEYKEYHKEQCCTIYGCEAIVLGAVSCSICVYVTYYNVHEILVKQLRDGVSKCGSD